MGDPKLEWMYRNSSEVVDSEEYLLGKPIDKAFEQSSLGNEIEKDCLPTPVLGSSSSNSNIQVDVIRKMKEDPLEIIRQQEVERRKQLLKNPVKLKKLQNMASFVENNQDPLKAKQSKDEEEGKKSRKRKSIISRDDGTQDLDRLLISKYLSLMKKHGIRSLSELASLKVKKKKEKNKIEESESDEDPTSSSDSSSTDSSDDENVKKGKYKQKKKNSNSSKKHEDYNERESGKKQKRNRNSDYRSYSSESVSDSPKRGSSKRHGKKRDFKNKNNSSQSESNSENEFKETYKKKSRASSYHYENSRKSEPIEHSAPPPKHKSCQNEREPHRDSKLSGHREGFSHNKNRNNSYQNKRPKGLSEEEKQKKLQEMMDNAKWRDENRVKNVARYKKEDSEKKEKDYNEDFIRKQMSIATSSGSVEYRIKSNINNIQRSKFSMDENFARR